MGGKRITREQVETVKTYKRRYPNITQDDLGRFAGVDGSTVSRILGGKYDHMLGAEQPANDDAFKREVIDLLREIADALAGDGQTSIDWGE